MRMKRNARKPKVEQLRKSFSLKIKMSMNRKKKHAEKLCFSHFFTDNRQQAPLSNQTFTLDTTHVS
jgi:hypothetical protein